VTVPVSVAASISTDDTSTLLSPYVPRLVVDWLRATPDALHREIEGSLVFVDISGFTALTERFAKKGKIGAELMRDALDGVFRALLDEAYDWGASLLKWGGDALLLLFDGPEHPQRSSRAAWEMQRTIDRVGRVHASGGTVVLRMSVGIGTGTFHFFMTGSVHRELLIAGPAVTETLVMEAIADAGEIGLSPGLALLLDPACVGPNKLTARLLASPPAAERQRAPDIGDVSSLDIASCIPVAARAHVLLQKSEAEHRTITAAFIDLMDTDRLLTELGPDGLATGLDERVRSIEEAALRYEVPFYESDVGKSSVKALLTAGAPSSTGHDEERMLRALREIMDKPGIVPLRVGVNTGKVFTGDFGPPYRRAYRVFGDAINTAARVMAKAEPGQILSTEIVLNRSRTLFATTSIEPFAAKGKAEPVHASIVGPVTGKRDAHHGGAPLMGRDAELTTLMEAVDQARSGRGSVVEVVGGPGLGKTRLVEEVIARSPDFRVLQSRCEEYEASTPYFAMRAVIRAFLELDPAVDADATIDRLREVIVNVDGTLEPWLPLFGILLGIAIPDTAETAALDQRFLRERLAEATTRLLWVGLAGSPAMVIIEDAQHMDDATGDLLLRLSNDAADRRQMLIVTHHGDGEVFEPAVEAGLAPIRIRLGPLSFEATVEILDLITEDQPLRPHEINEIARRSGGNILFLFQLLETVRETGTIDALPDSIESLIAADIDLLGPTDRTILRYAAVLGASFDPELLREAVREEVDLDEGVWRRLGDLLEREPSGALRFRNALIRDGAYEGLPYRRRRALHDRVGMTIEARAGTFLDDEVGVLAFHYYEAQRWDKAWRFCRQAGDRAMAVYANVEATRFYDRALTSGRRMHAGLAAELASLYELKSDAQFRLGEFGAADRALKSARRLLESDPVRAAPIVVNQAMLSTRVANYRQSTVRVGSALRALESHRGRAAAASRARLMVPFAVARYLQNRRVESIAWCRRAEREARRGRAPDALAGAYKILDIALLENGEIEKANYSGRALAIYEELGDLRNQTITLNNLGLIAHDLSEWDRSRQLYERSLAVAEQIGDRSLGALVKYNISEILSDQGRYDEAEPLLREVLRVWRASGADADAAEAKRELARLLARRGDIESARGLLESARAEQVHAGKRGEILTTDTRLAEMFVLAGEGNEAMTVVDRALNDAATVDGGSVYMAILHRLRGWAFMQMGQPDAASEALRLALALARKRGDTFETALALQALVALGGTTGLAVDALEEERRDLFERLGVLAAPTIPVGAASSGASSPRKAP
jgi:predicted ATPase/class 3 adenylate cyclase